MPSMALPAITPVESCLAVIGLRTVISKKVERVTKGTLDRINTLPREISKQARNLVNDKLSETFYSDLNYREMLHDLSAGINLDQIQKTADAFPEEYRAVGHALSITVSQVITALMKMVPTSVYQTATGPTHLVPDDISIWKFKSILEVLDNPMLVFPLIATGALLRSQARAIRTLYPTLSAAIDAAILDSTIKAKTNKKSFELTARAEVGVKAWMDQSPVSKSLLLSSQAAIKATKEKQAAREAKQKSKSASMSETQSQRSDIRAPL